MMPATPARRDNLLMAIFIAVNKIAQFVGDPKGLLFVDSGAYFINALGVGFVSERSYFYGWLLQVIARPFSHLSVMVAAQMLAGAATAMLLWMALRRHAGVSRLWAAAAVTLFLWDPTQIVHEHLMMTESVAGMMAAVFLCTCLEYTRKPHWAWLPLLSVEAFLLVGLRVVYVPMVFAAALLLPWLALFPPRPLRQRMQACVVALALMYAGQAGYRHLTGWLGGNPPAYHFQTGFFLFGSVATIVTPVDSNHPGVRRAIERQMIDKQYALAEVSTDNRNLQMWDPNGLASKAGRALGLDAGDKWIERSIRLGEIAAAAIRRDPLGFLYIAWVELAEWCPLTRPQLNTTLQIENGSHPNVALSPNDWQFVGPHFPGYNAVTTLEQTPSRRFHQRSLPWLCLQYFSPLIGLAALALARPPARGVAVGFTLWNLTMMAVVCFGSPAPMRYLHPMSFTGFAVLAILMDSIFRRRPVSG